MTVTYSSDPVVKWSLAPGHFILEKGFTCTWERKGKITKRIKVRKGFTTDLASIPRIFQNIIPKVGKHIQPSIVHDWCFEDKVPGMIRKEADQLFLEGMKEVGVSWWKRNLMWAAVRVGGARLWIWSTEA